MNDEAQHASSQSVLNKVAGLAKEKVGALLGHHDIVEEGRAQQDRAVDQADVAMHERAAERAKDDAREALDRQRAAADDEAEY